MRGEITLTQVHPEDTDFIIAAMNESEVARWLTSVPQPYGLNEAAVFIADAGPEEFAIRVDGKMVGMLRTGSSLGIWIAPQAQHKGLGLRASIIGLSRYFMDESKQGIDAVYIEGNERSAALLATLGFQEKGAVTAWSCALSEELPAVSLYLSRDDFIARHAITVETPRLQISAYKSDDLPDLHRIVTIPDVASMLLRYFPEMTQDEVAQTFTGDGLLPPLRLVIRHEGKVIGSVGLLKGDPPSIAYYLDPAVAGQGFGQEAVAGFMGEVTERFGLTALHAEVFDDNPASAKILRNLGFQRIDDVLVASLGRKEPAPAGVFQWRQRLL